MGCGEYVCGLEPCNAWPLGRDIERESGNLKFMEPGQKINFKVEFNILNSCSEIDNLKKVLM